MADNRSIGERTKQLWIRGMKAVGNVAQSVADNTQAKIVEMNLRNQKRERMADLSETLYAMWLKGIRFPDEINRILEEIQTLDVRLDEMRAEKAAQERAGEDSGEEQPGAAVSDPDDAEAGGQRERDETPAISGEMGTVSSVQTEINGMFDQEASVEKMADKMNTSLEQLTDRIRTFSQNEEDDVNI